MADASQLTPGWSRLVRSGRCPPARATQPERWASASGISPNDRFPPPLTSALGRTQPVVTVSMRPESVGPDGVAVEQSDCGA